jgi:hypothetical protein
VAIMLSRRGNLFSLLFQIHHEFSSPSADRRVPWKAVYGLYHVPKPLLGLCPLTSTRQGEYADAEFSHNNRVHDKISFVRSQPVDNLVVGTGFVGSLNTFASTR